MFLKCSTRWKDGKEHRSGSVVESRRIGRRVAQRHVLYLGEINDSQQAAGQKAIAVFDERDGQSRQCALFPADRTPPATDVPALQVRLDQLQLSRPRSWGLPHPQRRSEPDPAAPSTATDQRRLSKWIGDV